MRRTDAGSWLVYPSLLMVLYMLLIVLYFLMRPTDPLWTVPTTWPGEDGHRRYCSADMVPWTDGWGYTTCRAR